MKTLYQILSLPALALLLGACSQPEAQINIDAAQRGADKAGCARGRSC